MNYFAYKQIYTEIYLSEHPFILQAFLPDNHGRILTLIPQ